MALRVKNIQQGFVDATGFHPIRSSADYDDGRTGDNYEPSPRPRKKKAATKKRKPVAKKRAAVKKRKPAVKKRATKRVAKKATTTRRRNPITLSTADLQKAKQVGMNDYLYYGPNSSARGAKTKATAFLAWFNTHLFAPSHKTRLRQAYARGWDWMAKGSKQTVRKSNPLPIGLNWTKAYIRRNEDGDLQALLPLPHLTGKKKR